jgi:retinol dehydrogenase 12
MERDQIMPHEMSMKGQTCLITGATNGIGHATALALADKGATVIIVSRNEAKCAQTVESIKGITCNQAIEYMVADLSSQSSIRQLAVRYKSKYDKLDVLINNAGMIFLNHQETVDGIEMTWGLNHLGYFLLTYLLLDTIKASAPARIISVASSAHQPSSILFEDIEYKHRRYNGLGAYAQSKLANIMFTYALARRLEGSGVTANSLHPGAVATGFAANNGVLAKNIGRPLMNVFSISATKGAMTSVYLASAPEVATVTGKYFDKQKPVSSNQFSYDEDAQEKLWDLSLQMTGLAVLA